MLWPAIIALLLLLAAAGIPVRAYGRRRLAGARDDLDARDANAARVGGAALTAVSSALAVGALVFSSLTTVDANSVGVVTALGSTRGTVDSGPHLLAPWDTVESFSTRVQVTDRKAGPEGDVPQADCVQVNLKGGAGACADLTIRYVVNPGDVLDLWTRYGSFAVVRDRLLRSATDNAAKIVYGEYEPQAAISGDAIPGITQKITDELGRQLAQSGLTLLAVAPGQLHLAPDVQNRLNNILNAQSDTQVAEQRKAMNQAQAEANKILNDSLTPAVLAKDCLDAAVQAKPAVLGCVPGAPTPPVIVNPGGR